MTNGAANFLTAVGKKLTLLPIDPSAALRVMLSLVSLTMLGLIGMLAGIDRAVTAVGRVIGAPRGSVPASCRPEFCRVVSMTADRNPAWAFARYTVVSSAQVAGALHAIVPWKLTLASYFAFSAPSVPDRYCGQYCPEMAEPT